MPKSGENEKNNSKLLLELVNCSKCGNAFMRDPEDQDNTVCENCIKLQKRKRNLQLGLFDKVIEQENKMEDSINQMKNQLRMTKGKFNKNFFLNEIKRRSENLKKSIELVEKVEDTDDENYIEEYKKLFDKMKKDFK
jgi:hypothetical protein